MTVATTGIVLASPALAVTSPGHMCVYFPNDVNYACAEGAATGSPVPMALDLSQNQDWFMPSAPGSYGKIRVDNSGEQCLQLDAADDDTVILATCSSGSPTYQEWMPVAAPPGGDFFYSEWNTSYCLTYDEESSIMRAIGCGDNWYQIIFSGASG